MLYFDIPTRFEFSSLAAIRADACVSLYPETTRIAQRIQASRIALGNLARDAQPQREETAFDKRRPALIVEELDVLIDDEAFCRFQANSLAIFVTADDIHICDRSRSPTALNGAPNWNLHSARDRRRTMPTRSRSR